MSEFYDALETRAADEREQEQLVALKNQLQHAKTNAPAYTESLASFDTSDLKSLADLSSYPVTRKSELIIRQSTMRPFGG